MGCSAGRLVLPLLLLPAVRIAAQEGLADSAPSHLPPQYGDRPDRAARAKAAYEANLTKYKSVDDVLVLPGLVADRRAKRVELLAEATGLAADSFVEFPLVDATSGKGYEALLWSHARPSDVHRALEFIGVPPGKPFNPAKLRIWAKGERVIASVAGADGCGDGARYTTCDRCTIRDRCTTRRRKLRLRQRSISHHVACVFTHSTCCRRNPLVL